MTRRFDSESLKMKCQIRFKSLKNESRAKSEALRFAVKG